MSNIDMRSATIELEPALRQLVKSTAKVSDIAAKFKVPKEKLWAWLGHFNHSRRELTNQVIDRVKTSYSNPVQKQAAAVTTARGGIALMVARKPAAPVTVEAIAGPGDDIAPWLQAQKIPLEHVVASYILSVTPNLARSWLSLNKGNRNPSRPKIARFSAAIKDGKWVLNGETIKFSGTGRLLDGQSRLRAIIDADTAALLEVRGGLPDQAQESMDTGEGRKHSHQLEMLGEKNPNETAAALRMVFMWLNGVLGTADAPNRTVRMKMSNTAIKETLEKHPGIRLSVGRCMPLKAFLPVSQGAAFHYIFALANPAKANAFIERLATGVNLASNGPIYHLRERLMQDRLSQAKLPARVRHALIVKAWNAWLAGKTVDELDFQAKETFPVIAGIVLGAARS